MELLLTASNRYVVNQASYYCNNVIIANNQLEELYIHKYVVTKESVHSTYVLDKHSFGKTFFLVK